MEVGSTHHTFVSLKCMESLTLDEAFEIERLKICDKFPEGILAFFGEKLRSL